MCNGTWSLQEDLSVSSAPSVVNVKTMPTDELLPTRASLLRRLKDAGNHASWNEFHQLYRTLIFSVGRRAGLNEVESNEVVQDTLIAVAKKMPEFRYDPAVDSFKGWLLTLTRWRILDQLEKRKARQEQSGPARTASSDETRTATIDRVPDTSGCRLEAIWDEEWERNLLQAALARIKRQVAPQQYEIYHLHVVLGKSVREVTRALGVNTGQVYLAKHRMSRLLKKAVEQLRKEIL